MRYKKKAEKTHEEAVTDNPTEETVAAEESLDPASQTDQSEEPEMEKKPATEPWKAENAPDSPAKRGILGLTRTKAGFATRWVRYDRVDTRKGQGYTLADAQEFNATADENGMIRRNELVLMVVPKEVFDARRKQVQELGILQAKSAKREFLRERESASRQSGHNLSVRDEERDEE